MWRLLGNCKEDWVIYSSKKTLNGNKKNLYQHGDKNTRYFHACPNQRRKKNWIQELTIRNEMAVYGQKNIAGVVDKYFLDIFHSFSLSNNDLCLQHVKVKVTTSINEELLNLLSKLKLMKPSNRWPPWNLLDQTYMKLAFTKLFGQRFEKKSVRLYLTFSMSKVT